MKLIHLVYALVLAFAFPQFVQAITITASPNPANVNQSVGVQITANFPFPDICSLEVNFGDGSGWQPAGNCDGIANCVRNTSHNYNSTGTYQIQARSDAGCIIPPALPDPASYNIQIVQPATPQPQPPPTGTTIQAGEELPIGIAGVMYRHQLTTTGARGAVRFQLVGGRLPPGIRLNPGGQLSGIPTLEDDYNFRLRISDQSRQSIVQDYLLIVEQAVLNVTVSPDRYTLARNREGSYQLKYDFTSTEPLDDTLRSTQGQFYAGSRRLGISNTTVMATMRRGKAQATETVTVPASVLQAAQRLGLSDLRYERVFTADYMKAQTTSSTVIPVGIRFVITEVRIYFGNETGQITVKRNERDVKASVDIRYEGAGTLEGYWEADGRVLMPVRKELRYSKSKTITLDLPKAPPLPTYSIGSHRLRFVITKPRMKITFPEAIYMVSSEGLAERFPIILDSPADNARLNHSELRFNWQNKRGIATYLIEFYATKDEPPIFSAYTKTENYTIPKPFLNKYFSENTDYWWMVTGKNAEGESAAQSRMSSFDLFTDTGTASE